MALTIPVGITIQRDGAQEAALRRKTREVIEDHDRKPGLHASGMLDPRQEYWKQVDPQPLTDREVMVFFVGKLLHAFILGAVNEGEIKTKETDEGSTFSEDLGLWYSPDYNRDGLLAEIKTTRSMFEPKTAKDIDSYIEQLLVYMAAENLLEAQIWVLYLSLKDPVTNRTNPDYRVFTITIPEESMAAVKAEIKATGQAITEALAKKDWRGLPLCRSWKCRPGDDGCPWWDKCKPEGRWKPRG